jgi:hypothetical protein
LIRSRLSIITADVSIENFRQATQRERPASIDYNPRSYIALACHNADSFLDFVEKSIARLLLALLHWCACYSASLGRQSKPSRSDPRVGRCDPFLGPRGQRFMEETMHRRIVGGDGSGSIGRNSESRRRCQRRSARRLREVK